MHSGSCDWAEATTLWDDGITRRLAVTTTGTLTQTSTGTCLQTVLGTQTVLFQRPAAARSPGT